MKRLKEMKDALVCCAECQIYDNLDEVDTHELGEVIDMIKDLEEAMYYCVKIEKDKEEIIEMEEDFRVGKSYKKRKNYIEAKESHDKTRQMRELEEYMKELTDDILEMIKDSTPEEKIILSQKLSTLSEKIQ